MTTDNRYTFIFVHGMNVMLKGLKLPMGKLRPEIAMRYCICESHCRSTMMLSDSSVSSSPGLATTVTSFVADNFAVNAPGRCANALSRHTTDPNSQFKVGGEEAGIANEIGYVYTPILLSA